MTNVCPERMLSKASVCMGKGCSLCVVMPMMCDSNGCLWNLHGEGGGVVLFWEGHEITPQGIVHPNILIYDRVSFNLRKNLNRRGGGWRIPRAHGFGGAREALRPIQHQD